MRLLPVGSNFTSKINEAWEAALPFSHIEGKLGVKFCQAGGVPDGRENPHRSRRPQGQAGDQDAGQQHTPDLLPRIIPLRRPSQQ